MSIQDDLSTVESVLIETVAKWEIGKISAGLYYIWQKKRKNIKAGGQSNLISLANWLESRVVLPKIV